MKPLLSLVTLLAGTALLLPCTALAQGSLTPPGAPAATMKTLDQIEPQIPINATNTPGSGTANFIISNPGSYYLTGNVAGVSGRAGIVVTASNVSIDLRGYALTGVAGALAGISFVTPDRVFIRHGSVNAWPGGGIVGTNSDSSRVENVIAEGNTGVGIVVGNNGTITGCTARNNAGAGGLGIGTGTRSLVVQCVAASNGQNGISVGPSSVVLDCVASVNTGIGVTSAPNASGIRLTGCTADANAGAGGIVMNGVGCVVERCVARSNAGLGISVASATQVRHCAVSGNGSGIVATIGCTILDNNCFDNGLATFGAGIRVSGSGNRIEANVCRGNGVGIETQVSNSLVIRNLCSANGDIDIPTNYVLVGTGAAPRINASSMATNTNPHVNFEF